jgi:hypothetical protein
LAVERQAAKFAIECHTVLGERMGRGFTQFTFPESGETELRINWRRNRTSPPKCLHCGSTNIMPIPDAKEFAHPITGERVVVAGCGFVSTDEWHAEFTPEGDVLCSACK